MFDRLDSGSCLLQFFAVLFLFLLPACVFAASIDSGEVAADNSACVRMDGLVPPRPEPSLNMLAVHSVRIGLNLSSAVRDCEDPRVTWMPLGSFMLGIADTVGAVEALKTTIETRRVRLWSQGVDVGHKACVYSDDDRTLGGIDYELVGDPSYPLTQFRILFMSCGRRHYGRVTWDHAHSWPPEVEIELLSDEPDVRLN